MERIANVESLRSWTDKIPFHYEYTAGVAGERFLRGLQKGKILASKCGNCGRMYLPPKAYCIECFLRIDEFVEVGPVAVARAVAESHVDFQGNQTDSVRTFAFLEFKGVTGGLLHYVYDGARVGAKVRASFRAPGKRTGTLLDIERFVKV